MPVRLRLRSVVVAGGSLMSKSHAAVFFCLAGRRDNKLCSLPSSTIKRVAEPADCGVKATPSMARGGRGPARNREAPIAVTSRRGRVRMTTSRPSKRILSVPDNVSVGTSNEFFVVRAPGRREMCGRLQRERSRDPGLPAG